MLNFTGLIFHNKFNAVASKKFQNAQSCVDNEVVKRLADYTPIAKSIYANYGKMSHSHNFNSRTPSGVRHIFSCFRVVKVKISTHALRVECD